MKDLNAVTALCGLFGQNDTVLIIDVESCLPVAQWRLLQPTYTDSAPFFPPFCLSYPQSQQQTRQASSSGRYLTPQPCSAPRVRAPWTPLSPHSTLVTKLHKLFTTLKHLHEGKFGAQLKRNSTLTRTSFLIQNGGSRWLEAERNVSLLFYIWKKKHLYSNRKEYAFNTKTSQMRFLVYFNLTFL